MEVTEKIYEKAKKCKVSKALIGYEADGKYMVDEQEMKCSCGVRNCHHVVAVAIELGKEVNVVKEGLPTECVGGYDRYEVISAFHKELRRGDKEEAYYWLQVMIDSGFSQWYLTNYIVGILSEELCVCNMTDFNDIKSLSNYKGADPYRLYAMVEKFCEAKKWWYCEKCAQRRTDWIETGYAVKKARKKIPVYTLDTHTRRGKKLYSQGKADMRWSGTIQGMFWRRRAAKAGLDLLKAEWYDVDMSDEKELDNIENG